MTEIDYSNVFIDGEPKSVFDPANPPSYENSFVEPVEPPPERLKPLSLKGTIPPENVRANSDEVQDLLERGLFGGVESLTDSERKVLKMAREQFPDVDAVFAESELRAQDREERREAGSQDPETALLQRMGQAMVKNAGQPQVGLVKAGVDLVATVGEALSGAIREESDRIPAPISPFRDTNEDPLTPEEVQSQREFNQLSDVDKIGRFGQKVGFGAITGSIDFVTQALDPIVNPEKYGTTTAAAIEETAVGLVDMLAEAPDQAAYLAEITGAPDFVTKLLEGVGTVAQGGRLLFTDATREELKKKAINHLYKNPESLLFAILMAKSLPKLGQKVADLEFGKPKLGPPLEHTLPERKGEPGETVKLEPGKKPREITEAADATQAKGQDVQAKTGAQEAAQKAEAAKEVVPPEGLEAPRPPSIPEGAGFEAGRLNSDIAHHREAIEANQKFIAENPNLPPERLTEVTAFQKRLGEELITSEAALEQVHNPPPTAGPQPPETLRLSKQEHSNLREQFDIKGLSPVERKAHTAQFEKARERGYDVDAPDIADRILDKGEAATAAQRAGLFDAIGKLKKEADGVTKALRELETKRDEAGAEFEMLRRDELRERIKRLSDAYDQSGTEAGRAGALSQVTLNLETWDVESLNQRGRESARRSLTRNEEQVLEANAVKIVEAETRVEELRTTLGPEVEAAQLKINEEFYADPKIQKRARKRTESLITALEKRGETLEALETAADAVLGKKAQGYPKVLNPKDIKALNKQLSDLRWNAYNSVPYSNTLEGVFKRIDQLKDDLANLRKLNKKGERLPLTDLSRTRSQLRELRKDLEPMAEIAERRAQLESGDLEIVERPPTAKLPPELEQAEIDLLNAQQKARQDIVDLAPVTVRGVVKETANILRTLKATTDVSYVGRQGALPSAALLLRGNKAGAVPEAFLNSLRAAWKTKTAEQIDFQLRSEPLHYLREEAGLEIVKLKDTNIYAREEAFWSNTAEKIPGYGRVIAASNRNMVTGLNVLRARLFDSYVELYPNATLTELKAWADVVNVTSGRGNLGRLKNIASELSFGLFAPRFTSSRMETPFLLLKYWKEPRVRKEIAKDMSRSAALAGSVLAIASLAGYEVGTNFRDADFGKIRDGDTRIDIFAGLQQWMRFLFRLGNAVVIEPALDVTGIDVKDVPILRSIVDTVDYPYEEDPLELIWNYAKYKAAPTITLPYTLSTGHDVVYRDQGRLEALSRAVAPIVAEDIAEAAFSERGSLGLASVSPFGIGVSTYPDSETRVRRHIADLRFGEKPDEEAAQALQDDWNQQNPDDQIKQVTDPNKQKQDPVDLSKLKVDPRTAPIDSLVLIPKIGEVNAKRIDEWRKTHKITTVEDLEKIPGIGPKTIEVIRPYIHLLIEEGEK